MGMSRHMERIAKLAEQIQADTLDVAEAKAFMQEILEENDRLHDQLAECQKQASDKYEEYEQEAHRMRSRTDHMKMMEAHLSEDNARLQRQIDELTLDAEVNLQVEVKLFKDKIDELRSKLEHSQENERNLQERYDVLEQNGPTHVTENEQERPERTADQSSLYQYAQTQEQIVDLKELNEELTSQLHDYGTRLQAVEKERDVLQKLLMEKSQELEEAQCQMSSYLNALERSRQEMLEYKCQMENSVLQQPQIGEKGNSLFGELEDRRVEAETRLVDYSSQLGSLRRQLDAEKQQHHRLKVQMTTLLQANSSGMSKEHTSHMEGIIMKLRQEKQTLMAQLEQHETTQKQEMGMLAKLKSDSGEEKFDQYLMAVIKSREKEVTSLKQRVNQQNFEMTAKEDRIIACNRQISTLETEVAQMKHANMKQQLKFAELEMKLQLQAGEPLSTQPKKRREHIEIIPLHGNIDENTPGHDQECENITTGAVHMRFANSKCTDLPAASNIGKRQALARTSLNSIEDKGDLSLHELLGKSVRRVNMAAEVTIIEDGDSECYTESLKTDENVAKKIVRRDPAKPKGVVQQNVKKIGPADKSQCKQQ